MAIADFNRDGNADVVTLNHNDGTLALLLGDGKGGFAPAPTSPIAMPQSAAIAAGDFNGDGNPDLAITGGQTEILLGDGKGGFTKGAGIPSQYSYESSGDLIAVGDFNGDKKLDLILWSQINPLSYIWLGDGSGGFGTPRETPLFGNSVSSIAVGDFNGDGNLDLAVDESGPLFIYAGDGTGSFPKAYQLVLGAASASSALVTSGDFQGTGRSDLLNGSFTWYWTGTGIVPFNRVTSYVPTIPAYVVTGDFNGDGKLDWAGVNPGFGTVTVELGDGTGAFTPAPGSPYPTGGSPFALAAGDFNGDGKLDLAVDTGSNVVLLLNSVPPAMGPAPSISAVVNAASYVSEDIPGESYVTLFGSNLAASSNDPVVAVTITDTTSPNVFQYPASILYAGPGQVNIYVPTVSALGAASLQISNRFGASAPFPITLGTIAPGLFTVDAAGKIPAAQVLAAGANNTSVVQPVANCSNGTCSLVPITLDPSTPTYLVLYGTGIRGEPSAVSVTIGGVAATVTYANAQGDFPGLDQVNVVIPQQLAGSKLVNVQLQVATESANTVEIYVQ
ncbi:MAG TPA: FG-GAP-like repeat-containing protein [Bryobacteraceae bacterium]|nr:FG-GAP-like repeat-containing protein [Bryobacteraceae bacterium]